MVNALAAYARMGDPVDPRVAFWKNPVSWPLDAGEYIFAGRALLKLGQRLLPDEWSDEAPTTELVRELPEHLRLSTPREEVERGVRILHRSATEYAKRVGRGLLSNFSECEYPNTSEWANAVELAKKMHEENWAKLLPFYKLVSRVDYACREGQIASAVRAQAGGPIADQVWHLWNYENSWLRFDTCRVILDQPERLAAPAEQAHWLYFKKGSLDEYLNRLKPSPSEQLDAGLQADTVIAERISNVRPIGRPSQYDWKAFAQELYRRHRAGLLESSARAITASMLEWCYETWGHEPSESHARERVHQFLIAFNVADNSDS
ncbi:MAG: hypothetical protein H6876_10700 [Hyphomicrobiaceae bacterium]|nr:hypothetical protein [Hyphomicrobiaceae bacterium]